MTPKQRMLFLIEHMNTPFKEEIRKDFEASLNEARHDELLSTGVFDGEMRHYNDDGSTTSSIDDRMEKLEKATKW